MRQLSVAQRRQRGYEGNTSANGEVWRGSSATPEKGKAMERFVVRRDGECAVIVLRGEIVMDMIEDCKQSTEHLFSAEGCREVVVDLAEVTFMDSSAIGFLIGLRRRAESAGRRMRLRNPSHQITKLFDMLRLSDFFAMGQNRDGGCNRSA